MDETIKAKNVLFNVPRPVAPIETGRPDARPSIVASQSSPLTNSFTLHTELDKGKNNSGVKFAPVCLPRPRLRTASVCATRAKRGVRVCLLQPTTKHIHHPNCNQAEYDAPSDRPIRAFLGYFTGNAPRGTKKRQQPRAHCMHTGRRKVFIARTNRVLRKRYLAPEPTGS